VDLEELLRQRASSLLVEEGVDPDIVLAVAGHEPEARKRLLANVCDAKARVLLLQRLRQAGNLSQIQSVVQRASRLAEKGNLARDVLQTKGVVDPELFESASEAAMLRVLNDLTPIAASADRYEELAMRLAVSADMLKDFFDGPDSVLVMCDDLNKRENRLNLLSILRNQASILADFRQLVS
jgi:glycyl-tRNA synthetase beta chain